MWQICYTNWLLLPFSLGSRTLAWNYETSLPSTGFVYTYVYLLYSTCVFSGAGPVFQGYLCLWNCVLSTHLICSLHWSEFVCPNLPACFCPLVGSYWDWPLHVFGEGEGPLVPLIKSFPDCLALFGLVFGRLLKFDSSRRGGKTTFDSPSSGMCIFSGYVCVLRFLFFFWSQSRQNSDQ